jgi:hypothetical protein
MTIFRPSLAPLLCLLVIMGCKKKDTPPELASPDAPLTDLGSKQAAGEADVSSEDEGTETAWTGKRTIHFTGNVEKVEMLGQGVCKAIPVGPDPRFAMTVGIESVEEKDAPLQAGTTVAFAIHSPAKMFFGADWKTIKGKFSFQADVEKTPEGELWYQWLQLAPEKTEPDK